MQLKCENLEKKYQKTNSLLMENRVLILNDKTIEFRMFASTNDFSIYIKNIEFIHSLIEFTKSNNSLEFSDYIDFVNNKDDYHNLKNIHNPVFSFKKNINSHLLHFFSMMLLSLFNLWVSHLLG